MRMGYWECSEIWQFYKWDYRKQPRGALTCKEANSDSWSRHIDRMCSRETCRILMESNISIHRTTSSKYSPFPRILWWHSYVSEKSRYNFKSRLHFRIYICSCSIRHNCWKRDWWNTRRMYRRSSWSSRLCRSSQNLTVTEDFEKIQKQIIWYSCPFI